MAFPKSALLDIVVHRNEVDTLPGHHIPAPHNAGWLSYLTQWDSSPNSSKNQDIQNRRGSRDTNNKEHSLNKKGSSTKVERIGFKNPWPSWYKPTRKQVWDALEWGEDQDPCIQLAAQHVSSIGDSLKRSKLVNGERSRAELAAHLLQVQTPDFTYDPKSQKAKTTWLGHAGMLVQLPPLKEDGHPFRCVFDPIFSQRSSPSQIAGPIRSYPPPCKIDALPPIDVFMMSHNHHDHLDYDTVTRLWTLNKEWIRFVVPLGNKPWFMECGVDEQRVTELDWWESVELSYSTSDAIKITCTPCQHNSGRTGLDADQTLWSSWYIEHPQPEPYRVYFAGDTGYQFHPSPGWPPQPSVEKGQINTDKQEYSEKDPYPNCPAFQEIAERLGSPDLLLLPVAVGATYSFLRSYVPLPDALSPFPRHQPGLTGANHMPPWDAVKVLQIMTADSSFSQRKPPIAIAMHWGTFVPERTEVLKTLGQLEYACIQQNVQFSRSLEDVKHESSLPIFLALNHGQSVVT